MTEMTPTIPAVKTWLITGCSSGFGRRIAIAAAERGDHVVATVRDPRVIEDLAAAYDGRMLTLPLDVSDTPATSVFRWTRYGR